MDIVKMLLKFNLIEITQMALRTYAGADPEGVSKVSGHLPFA